MGAVAHSVKHEAPDFTRAHGEPKHVHLVDVLALNGRELLRLVLHHPNVLDRLSRCERCGAQGQFVGFGPGAPRRCFACDEGMCLPLGAQWWAKAAGRMRTACQRDRGLVSALKAEWKASYGDVPLPALPSPFEWLNEAWKRTGSRGRPLSAQAHFELAYAAGRFESAGVSLNKFFEILRQPDRSKRPEIYDRLPAHSRGFLGDDTRNRLARLPFVSTREEMGRRLRWARRQWTDPIARLRGERVRSRWKTPGRGRIEPTH